MTAASRNTTWRFPDKPTGQLDRAGLDSLPELYVAQLKMDGWRCVVERTAIGWTFTSRHKKPIPISAALATDVAAELAHLPIGTILDGEWLARRPAARDEALWLFDVMQYGGAPLWSEATADRLRVLRYNVPAARIVPTSENVDYGELFDYWRARGDAEGIVLKRRDARYIGSVRASANNPGWLRCKWRAGESGETVLTTETRRQNNAPC